MPLLLGTEHLGALFFSVFDWKYGKGKKLVNLRGDIY